MLFSVVIPAYNRAALLKAALESVFAQEFKDYEIIVVDDGSTDGTPEFVKSLGSRVQLLQQENQGPGAARNLGARQARGDYVVFLDSDDLWFPWTLGTLANLIREHNAPAILSAALFEFRDVAQLASFRPLPVEIKAFGDYLESSRGGFHVGAGGAALKRDEFQKVGGFTAKRINCEDHDLILRMGIARGFVHISHPALLGYRKHPVSATQNLAGTYAGCRYLLAQEKAGMYPGGAARRQDRERILTMHCRPASLACLKAGKPFLGLSLYFGAWSRNFRLGRLRYQAAFPVLAGMAAIKRLGQVRQEGRAAPRRLFE